MSGLLVRSPVTAGRDGFRDASSEHGSGIGIPLGTTDCLAFWRPRRHFVRRLCYCLHHPDGIFLLQAKARFDVDLANSWMIGDRETDVVRGLAAGVRTMRVAADHPVPWSSQPTAAERAARDLADAASWLAAADRLAGVPPDRPLVRPGQRMRYPALLASW